MMMGHHQRRWTARPLRKVEIYYQVIVTAVKDLRWKTAGGLDNISTAMVKRAPHSFLRALALFAARCANLKQFPRWFRLARANFEVHTQTRSREVQRAPLGKSPNEAS